MCIPSKIPRGGGRGVREGLGMDKIIGFYISPDLMFSITLVTVMHFHNYLCISISVKILKEIFAWCGMVWLGPSPSPSPSLQVLSPLKGALNME